MPKILAAIFLFLFFLIPKSEVSAAVCTQWCLPIFVHGKPNVCVQFPQGCTPANNTSSPQSGVVFTTKDALKDGCSVETITKENFSRCISFQDKVTLPECTDEQRKQILSPALDDMSGVACKFTPANKEIDSQILNKLNQVNQAGTTATTSKEAPAINPALAAAPAAPAPAAVAAPAPPPNNPACVKNFLPGMGDLYLCNPGFNPSAQDPSCKCINNNINAPAAAAGAAAACAPGSPNCTSGGGQRCSAGTGAADPDGDGIYTAIGCIPTEPKAFVEGVLKFSALAAGGIAFLLMIFGALGLIMAEGNPEAVKHSQEQFYSAIIGLLLIIFSVLLMQVIGVDILGLPGFGRL